MFSGGFSMFHWIILGVIILLLFGKGRFSDMAGDIAKGLKSFKRGLSDEESHGGADPVDPPRRIHEAGRVESVPVLDPKPVDAREI